MIKFQPNSFIIRSTFTGVLAFFAIDAHAFQINALGLSNLNSFEQTAVTAAIGQIDSLFSNNVTLSINFSGTMPTDASADLGASGANAYKGYTYGSVATAIDQNYGSNILSTTVNPTGGSLTSLIYLSAADVAVLTNQSPFASVGTVYLNSTDFNSASNSTNLEGVAEHEITEVLGRTSGLANTTPEYNLLDLFRYTSVGQISTLASDQNVYFSVDGGKSVLMYYNSIAGGDFGDWATTSPTANALDAFNYATPVGGPATGLRPVDLLEMQALGYTLTTPVPLPAATWSFMTGLFGLLFLCKNRKA